MKQAIAGVRVKLEIYRDCRGRKRFRSDLPEISVATHESPQPCIFELPGAPRLHQRGTSAGEEHFGAHRNGPRIDDDEAVESDRSDPEPSLRTCHCRSGDCRRGDGREEQMAT